MGKIIQVGMADLKIASAPDLLMTPGLGSCIGICIYDPVHKLASLAHIMLPYSTSAKDISNRAKFADTAIDFSLEQLERAGASCSRVVAKIAGGAQMFKFSGESDIMKIGLRNLAAVEEQLSIKRIRLLANDTGGNYGRTITFNPGNGELLVKTIGYGERII